jgi:hypothetical protein
LSLHNIKRGLSGTSREGTEVVLTIDGEEVQRVTLQAGKYLTVEAQEYILVTQGKTVRLDVGTWSREYTVPDGRVMVVRYTYEDEEPPR